MDPVQGVVTCTGAHTSRAARIEPIAKPGSLYCSRAFAAMADETRALFRFERVGKVPLAKKYGMLECYSVEWSENKTGAIRYKIIILRRFFC